MRISPGRKHHHYSGSEYLVCKRGYVALLSQTQLASTTKDFERLPQKQRRRDSLPEKIITGGQIQSFNLTIHLFNVLFAPNGERWHCAFQNINNSFVCCRIFNASGSVSNLIVKFVHLCTNNLLCIADDS